MGLGINVLSEVKDYYTFGEYIILRYYDGSTTVVENNEDNLFRVLEEVKHSLSRIANGKSKDETVPVYKMR